MVEMAMNIKSEEAHRLATEIAQITGTSLTQAVTEALREKRKSIEAKDRWREILENTRVTAELLKDMPSIDEVLYDPVTGLPR
jgi:antitoxin VapB